MIQNKIKVGLENWFATVKLSAREEEGEREERKERGKGKTGASYDLKL